MPLAGSAPGDPGAAAGEGGSGEHDQGATQRLLGPVAAEGGMGGSARGDRDDRGVVRAGAPSDGAKVAWPRQASHRLPACDRLAGAQTRSVRPLLLSGGPVSHQPVSSGLRRVDADAVGACGEPGIPGDFAVGGAGQRECRGGRVGSAASPRRCNQRGRRGVAST